MKIVPSLQSVDYFLFTIIFGLCPERKKIKARSILPPALCKGEDRRRRDGHQPPVPCLERALRDFIFPSSTEHLLQTVGGQRRGNPYFGRNWKYVFQSLTHPLQIAWCFGLVFFFSNLIIRSAGFWNSLYRQWHLVKENWTCADTGLHLREQRWGFGNAGREIAKGHLQTRLNYNPAETRLFT